LMEEIRRSPVEVGGLFHTIYKVLYILGGAGFLPSTVLYITTTSSFEKNI